MKRRALGILFSAVLLLAIAQAPARAGFYVGIRGGLSNQNVSFESKYHFNKDSAVLYGAQVGFKFLALAVQGEFYRADHSDLKPDDFVTVDGYRMDYYYLGANAKLGIPLVILYPYLTVGYGKYSADINSLLEGKKSNSDWSFNVGAGAELTLGKVGLFAEVRYTDFSMDIHNLNWDFGGVDLHFGLNLHL